MRTDRWEIAGHGLLVGMIGYLVVLLGVGVGDLVQGRSFFYTFSLLGGWLFYGLEDPAAVRVWPGAVFAYNGLHFVIFLAFGMVASWMASLAERGPLLWYGGIVMYVFFFLHLFGAFLLMTEPMRSVLSLWHVSVPSLLALAAMSWVLLSQHPRLRREMHDWVDDTDGQDTADEAHGVIDARTVVRS